MANNDLVSPLASANPDVNSSPASGNPDPAPKIPAEVLKLGPVQALLAGMPPAVSASLKNHESREDLQKVKKHADTLRKAGFDFYKSLSGQFGVMYNRFHIHPADIQAADKAGKLLAIAPPWEEVEHLVAKSGHKHPLFNAGAPPAGFAIPTPQAPPQASSQLAPGAAPMPIKGPPAGAQRRLMAARVMNMQPGAPTSGPSPGSGRLLNNILKPVV